MANAYFDVTGTLRLRQVTPVIMALFGGFSLDPSEFRSGSLPFARLSDVSSPTWSDVASALANLARSWGLDVPADYDDDLEEVLELVAAHFGKQDQVRMRHVIESIEGAGEEELDTVLLYEIARQFDDGHGLEAIAWQGAWHSDRAVVDGFGGCGGYVGEHVHVAQSSDRAVTLGPVLDAALGNNEIAGAVSVIAGELELLLDGIADADKRKAVCRLLSRELSSPDTNRAAEFWDQLLGSVESLTELAETHGPRTLADICYLHAAIAHGGFIDAYPDDSRILDVIQDLPSAEEWMTYVQVEQSAESEQ